MSASGDFFNMYEADLVPAIFAPWPAEILDLVRAGPGDRVLDVGCGTGVVARAAADVVGLAGMVVGCDLKQGMLAVARSVTAGPGVTWVTGHAERLPLASASVDVVVCQQALQHVGDKGRALAEMRRVASPGGRVGVAAWAGIAACPGFAVLEEELAEHVGPGASRFAAAPFTLADGPALGRLARDAGLVDVGLSQSTHRTAFGSAAQFAAIFVSRPFLPVWDDHDPARWAQVRKAVVERLDPGRGGDGPCFPMTSHLLVGRVPE